jgi:hypothetical protein
MSAAHHGQPDGFSAEDRRRQQELVDRLIGQFDGTAKRHYSKGRLNAADDGDLALAVTADKAKNVVVISFGKPVDWIGLGPDEVNGLINLLMGKLRELGVAATISV